MHLFIKISEANVWWLRHTPEVNFKSKLRNEDLNIVEVCIVQQLSVVNS